MAGPERVWGRSSRPLLDKSPCLSHGPPNGGVAEPGRMHRSRRPEGPHGSRGFESLPHRHHITAQRLQTAVLAAPRGDADRVAGRCARELACRICGTHVERGWIPRWGSDKRSGSSSASILQVKQRREIGAPNEDEERRSMREGLSEPRRVRQDRHRARRWLGCSRQASSQCDP